MRRLVRTRMINESDKRLMLQVKNVVTRLVPDAEIVLYGSTARGTREPDSDYDILVLTGRKLSSEEEASLDAAVYDVELESEVVLSLIVYAQEEWASPRLSPSPYRKNVMKEGIIV
jgi:predicted nucleotidyltransferase